MKKENPFVVVGYRSPKLFCDRVKETKRLIGALENGRNVTLIAPRRYGKTGLIHHVFNAMSPDVQCLYLDIYALKNLTELSKSFATAVLGMLDPPVEKVLASVAGFFKSCPPTITPQEDGTPKFSFDIQPNQAEATLGEAFAYLKKKGQNVVIAIDEFQQILEFPEAGTEALLRGYVQSVPDVRFVFAGSRHHLMGEMFLSAKHPFYQSTDIMSLGVVDKEAYSAFAQAKFEEAKQSFKKEAFNALYDRFSGITWYLQVIMNRLWENGEGLVNKSQIDEIVSELVEDRALIFRDLYFSQTESCQSLLSAIAKEGVVRAVFSGEFISRHKLIATSTVRSALKALEDKDLVYRTENGYIVYDRILAEWLKMRN